MSTTASGTTASGTTASGTTASGTTASGTTASGTTASGTTAPPTTAPPTTAPPTTTLPPPTTPPPPPPPPEDNPDPDVYEPPDNPRGTGLLFSYSKYKDATISLSYKNIYDQEINSNLDLSQSFDNIYYDVSLYTTGATTGNMDPYIVDENFATNQNNLEFVFTQAQNQESFDPISAQRYYKLLFKIYNEGLDGAVLVTVYHVPATIESISVEDAFSVTGANGQPAPETLSGLCNFSISFDSGALSKYVARSIDIYTGAASGTTNSLDGFQFLKTVSFNNDSAYQNISLSNNDVTANEMIFYKFVPFDDFGQGNPTPDSVSGYIAYKESRLIFPVGVPPVLSNDFRISGFFSGYDSPQQESGVDGAIVFETGADQKFYVVKSGQWKTLPIYEEISGQLIAPETIGEISGQAATGYNKSITGIYISGDSTKTIYLFAQDGSSISGDFVDNGGSLSDVVYATGDQEISGLKNFSTRPTVNGSGVLLIGEGAGGDYATTGYVTGVSGYLQDQITNLNNATGSYVTGDVVRPSETGNFITTSQTGQFVGDSETGAFLTTGAADARYVNLTGNQTVSGTKAFASSIVLPSGAIVTGSGSISFDTSAAFASAAAGEINWNSDEQTFNLGLNGEVTLQVGLEQLVKVKAGADIRNGMTVYAAGQVGASANIEVLPFIASADGPNEIYFLGIATQEILNGNEGFATTFGKVRNVDGAAYSAGGVRDDADGSWSVGNILYASPHISGTFTTGAPVSPEKTMEIAMVLAAPNESNITLFVRAEHGYRLSDLHDVHIESLQDSNILKWNATSGRWENSNSINLSGISVSGNAVVTGAVVRPSETGNFITTSQTGQFVGDGETGAFLTTGAADARYALQSATGNFITTSQTGQFVGDSETGAFLTTGAADNRYALQSDTGNFITSSQTGAFAAAADTGAFLTTGAADVRYALQSATGDFVTTAQTGQFYPTSNPSGYITGVDLSAYVTGAVVRPSETGAFLTTGAADDRYALQSATGDFITTSQTGAFAAAANTGAFLTTGAADARYYGLADGQSISGYAITGYNDAVTGMTVTGDTTKTITLFQRDGGSITADFTDNGGAGATNVVYTTGNQIISGDKTFANKLIAATGFFGVSNSFGPFSSQAIGGGLSNLVSGHYSVIAGGVNNIAGAFQATIGGGSNNKSNATYATIGGGVQNIISGSYGTIGGGLNNKALGNFATVAGGESNEASYTYSTVAGGVANKALNAYTTIPGGYGAKAHAIGQLAYASNYFANIGDGQYIQHIFYGISLAGAGAYLSPSNDGVVDSIFEVNQAAIALLTIQVLGFDDDDNFSQAVRKVVVRKLSPSYSEEISHIESIGTDVTNAGSVSFEIYNNTFGIFAYSDSLTSNTRWMANIQGIYMHQPPAYP